jgi:hypothetical protein
MYIVAYEAIRKGCHLRAFLARRTRVARIPISTPRMFLGVSDCGRLGRQAAGHPWSALRVVKNCRKDCPTAEVLPRPKQQLCIQNGTRAYYLNYLQRRRVRGEKKRRQSDWLANQIDRNVMDRQVIDRQVETRLMSAGTQADRAAS